MKKPYKTPAIICETLTPETMLCGCKLKNPTLSEEQHCSYEPDGLGFTIFADGWGRCNLDPERVPTITICYHPGPTNLFGS